MGAPVNLIVIVSDTFPYDYSKFARCRFIGTRLTEAKAENCRFEECDFSGARMNAATFSDTAFLPGRSRSLREGEVVAGILRHPGHRRHLQRVAVDLRCVGSSAHLPGSLGPQRHYPVRSGRHAAELIVARAVG